MIRTAIQEDIGSVVEIYNQAIDAGFQTAFTERLSVEDRMDWFRNHLDAKYPIFVFIKDDKVIGWFSISPYRQGRAALRFTVEISYFVHKDHQRNGVGTKLMDYGIYACRMLGYKTALAIILEKNTGSVRLLENTGFKQWGYLPGVADFGGEECAHIYYGFKLN